jgi:hypothetical protein
VFNSPNENPQKPIRLFEVSLVFKFLSIDHEFFAQKYSKKAIVVVEQLLSSNKRSLLNKNGLLK